MKITILGCGSSGGVPLITGDWGSCNPNNPKNHRRRASILVQVGEYNILIDASPDLRQQLLEAKIDRIDAVLYTHAHADHILGTDELRQIYLKYRQIIPFYADEVTLDFLKTAFGYAIHPKDENYSAFLKPNLIEGPFTFQQIPIIPFLQHHGHQTSLGYRIDKIAYSTDFHTLPESSLDILDNLDLWIVDCLKYEPHPTHTHFDHTMNLIERLKPKKAILTHMTQWLDYDHLKSQLPPHIEPAFDGMVLTLENHGLF
jgi:phosphoribosyl 1,2-cyclic phosphate phosphodiesterase